MKGKKRKKYSLEFINRATELLQQGFNITKTSEILCDEFGIKYKDSIRRHVSTILK
jgi:hypothetical protein